MNKKFFYSNFYNIDNNSTKIKINIYYKIIISIEKLKYNKC
jgi:hypothetical protein